jgi:hypothetical protein
MSTLVDVTLATSAEPGSERLYAIGEVAETLAVHPRTLMVYERLGLVRPARRSNRRAYSRADVRWLTCLRAFNRRGGVGLSGLSTLLKFVPCWAIRAELEAGDAERAVPSEYPASACLSRVARAYSGHAPRECGGCENYRGAADSGREALYELSREARAGRSREVR